MKRKLLTPHFKVTKSRLRLKSIQNKLASMVLIQYFGLILFEYMTPILASERGMLGCVFKIEFTKIGLSLRFIRLGSLLANLLGFVFRQNLQVSASP
jgi:hypothetical protein